MIGAGQPFQVRPIRHTSPLALPLSGKASAAHNDAERCRHLL